MATTATCLGQRGRTSTWCRGLGGRPHFLPAASGDGRAGLGRPARRVDESLGQLVSSVGRPGARRAAASTSAEPRRRVGRVNVEHRELARSTARGNQADPAALVPRSADRGPPRRPPPRELRPDGTVRPAAPRPLPGARQPIWHGSPLSRHLPGKHRRPAQLGGQERPIRRGLHRYLHCILIDPSILRRQQDRKPFQLLAVTLSVIRESSPAGHATAVPCREPCPAGWGPRPRPRALGSSISRESHRGGLTQPVAACSYSRSYASCSARRARSFASRYSSTRRTSSASKTWEPRQSLSASTWRRRRWAAAPGVPWKHWSGMCSSP